MCCTIKHAKSKHAQIYNTDVCLYSIPKMTDFVQCCVQASIEFSETQYI